MPARRPHTKSRAGCQRCKEKHIKCDEVRPTCGACARYGVPCLPKPLKPLRRASSALLVRRGSETPSIPTSPGSSLASPFGRSSLSLWEFQLVHHWILHVTESFHTSPGYRRAWADLGVKVAIEHDFLLHMILMLSALHLGLTKSPAFTEAHRAFILGGCSEATARFRIEAENISYSNGHAVHAFPYLMFMYALALPLYDRGDRGGEAILDELIHIFVVSKGNAFVRDTCSPPIRAHLLREWMKKEDYLDESEDSHYDMDLASSLWALQPWIDSSDDDPRIQATNTEAIQIFTQTLKIHLKPIIRPLAWPNRVQSEFIELLRQRHPAALVILAHYGVVLGYCTDQWWCLNWGVRLVSVIAAMLPEKYQAAIAFPLKKLNLRNDQ
ncbi:hypothetical protein BDW74DRAFT_105905 [Aspergillus multicolor]|uniref:Zn(II)2Cys6 transcription factor domain-containing protein n=1 Tax=Aspergillus multicolor TaxID=41759 RepID=UPI003CCD5D76